MWTDWSIIGTSLAKEGGAVVAREEVDGALLVAHFDVLVVANQVARASQFENVLHAANRTSNLARGNVLLAVLKRHFLDLTHDAVLAQAVAKVQHSRQVDRRPSVGVCKLRIAENAVP